MLFLVSPLHICITFHPKKLGGVLLRTDMYCGAFLDVPPQQNYLMSSTLALTGACIRYRNELPYCISKIDLLILSLVDYQYLEALFIYHSP